MKRLIIRTNSWYDDLKEPYRFLLFIIPTMILLIGVYFPLGAIIKTISVISIYLMGFWRIIYFKINGKLHK